MLFRPHAKAVLSHMIHLDIKNRKQYIEHHTHAQQISSYSIN